MTTTFTRPIIPTWMMLAVGAAILLLVICVVGFVLSSKRR